MKNFFGRGEGRKKGALDGLNLFFGALLGANLGTLHELRLVTYIQLIVVLVGTVMALRMVSTSENRTREFLLLGCYLMALIALVVVPGLQPTGMSNGDLNRLVATLIIWVVMVLLLEVLPRRK